MAKWDTVCQQALLFLQETSILMLNISLFINHFVGREPDLQASYVNVQKPNIWREAVGGVSSPRTLQLLLIIIIRVFFFLIHHL